MFARSFNRRFLMQTLVALALLTIAAGCPSQAPGPTPSPSAGTPAQSPPIKLLVVEDVPLGKAIAREWNSQFEGQFEVQNVSREEVLTASRLPGDVVIVPNGYLGVLAERGLIAPLADDALTTAEFNRREIFDQVRLRDIAWGNKTLAVPLGSPQLLLVYRRDLFEKLSLAPPRTWAEYQKTAERLAAEGEATVAPALEPLADGWAGQMLLARAATYVMHRDQVSPLFSYTTLDPLITSRPYLRALEELVAAHKQSSQGERPEERRTPAQVLEELYAGRAAMAATWPAPVRESTDPCKLPIAFALLPGATEVYDFARNQWEPRESAEEAHVPLLAVSGRVAAITTTSTDVVAAQNFLAWLAGSEASAIVSPASAGTTLFRDGQLSSAGRWAPGLGAQTAREYGETLKKSASLQRYLSLRMPGRDEYLAALDTAVAQALAGEKPPAEALAAAADEWKKLTAKLGLENQRRALRRDLGLESLP